MAEEPAAHRPVLDALDGADLADGPSRPSRRAFARAMLRRAPDDLLSSVPAPVLARRLSAALDAAEGRGSDEAIVRVRRDDAGVYLEVVSGDRPFLLSTVTSELTSRGYGVRRSFHPIVGVQRDVTGAIVQVEPARHAATRESVLQLDLDRQPPTDDDGALVSSVEALLRALWTVTDDHALMRARLELAATHLRSRPAGPSDDPHDPHEVAELVDWLLDDHLVLLAVDERTATDDDHLGPSEHQLGLLRVPHTRDHLLEVPSAWPPATHDDPPLPALVTAGRTSARSPVQRRSRLDVIAVNVGDDDGRPVGQLRLFGLLTRRGIAEPASNVPLLRRRLRRILDAEDIVDGSYDAIALTSLFNALPKDELLHTSATELHRTLMALLHAEEHGEVATRVRSDDGPETVSVLVTVPVDRWDAALRTHLTETIGATFQTSEMDLDVAVDDRAHAIARFLLHRPTPGVADDAEACRALSDEVRRIGRSWLDIARDELAAHTDPSTGERLVREVGARLPRSYRDRVPPDRALPDLDLIDRVLGGSASLLVAVRSALRPSVDPPVRLVAVTRGQPLELSAFLPILESLGLTVVEEHPHPLEGGGPPVTLHDFGVRAPAIDLDADQDRIAEAILAAWRGHFEVDAMNQLVIAAGTPWQDVALLRAYRRVRRQLGTAYTPAYVEATMVEHPTVVRALVEHLHARFDPDRPDDAPDEELTRRRVLEAMDTLTRLDHDRILRGSLELMDATLRTNAFRDDAVAPTGEPYVALKLDPSRIADVPRPVPYREIFVHSPRVEGVHLRAGPVARGGLRWSDRRDDVRTEVLGLLKAQILKNAVIVPTGAKGGFVLLQEPDDPAELAIELRQQYVTFVRGLLDVTDDLDGDEVVAPPQVVRHDGDDPYLVVAADRGTATMSDTANEVAAGYGFWLDDAFASGGSHGYDHKALGITARGAWVAVSRHFRELGIDVERDAFTVAGIGDMSGDVFGNAMVRSRSLKLVAAFDHRHVFLDPRPDPEASFGERNRLLGLHRSSWADYDPEVLGPGGMIVDRNAVRAPLTDEVRELLRIDDGELSPPELIRAILRAPVDLLFAGGIGTYIKASTQRHEDVGDRVNDELRVDATEIRARVVGEGANLSITQPARIELARRGARLNQDAVDNAAGVAISDLEVNVKILLRLAEEEGSLSRPERDGLLEELTGAVVEQALRTVDRQAVAISREVTRSPALVHSYEPFLAGLERDGDLDRVTEVLPDGQELEARADAGAGLTRPELATVLAWAKRELKSVVMSSTLPESPWYQSVADRAFPPSLVERFPKLPGRHRLRHELIATQLANDVVDRMGPTFVDRLSRETGRAPIEVIRAFEAARASIEADRWWTQIEGLEADQDPARIRELEAPVEELLAALARAILMDPGGALPERRVSTYRGIAEELLSSWSTMGTADQCRARQAHARWLVDDLVEPELARVLATCRDLALVPDIAAVAAVIADGRGKVPSSTTIADLMLQVGSSMGIDRLEEGLRRVEVPSEWARRQRLGLTVDLRALRRLSTATALQEDLSHDPDVVLTGFLERRRRRIDRARRVVADAERSDHDLLDALAVAVRTLADTVRSFADG